MQIVEKRHGRRRIVEHIGSAHDEAELAVLLSAARQRLHTPQEALPELAPSPTEPGAVPGPVVEHSASVLLWQVLQNAYRELGFDVVDDAVFAQLVAARLIEPTSNWTRCGCWGNSASPHRTPTLYAYLARCVARDYGSQIAAACRAPGHRR